MYERPNPYAPSPEDNIRIEPLGGAALVEDLAAFDPAIALRIEALRQQQYTGMDFGIQMDPDAEIQPDPEDVTPPYVRGLVEQVAAYEWAMALARYPYQHLKDQDAVRHSSVIGLWHAVETYEPGDEQKDFLAHLSSTLSRQMVEDHGKSTIDAPSPAEFDSFVTENYMAELPSLAEDRLPKHVAEGEVVLILEDEQLVPGVVLTVTDRESQSEFVLNEIPEEEVPALQARLDQAYIQLQLEGSRITLGDEAADYEEIAEFESRMNPDPHKPAPDVRLIHALGRGPLWLYALHPQIKENPEYRPSTALVATDAQPEGAEMQVKDTALIPLSTWKLLATKPAFRELYLEAIGDEEDRQTLRQAIYDLKQESGIKIEAPHLGNVPSQAKPKGWGNQVIRVIR